MHITEFGQKSPVWMSFKENMGLGEITEQVNKRIAEKMMSEWLAWKPQWVKEKIFGSARDNFSKVQ